MIELAITEWLYLLPKFMIGDNDLELGDLRVSFMNE